MDKNLDELLKNKRFHLFLMVLSLFFFLISFAVTDLGSSEPSAFWYASSLPAIFYLGLILAAGTLLLSYRHNWPIRISSIILPVLYLYTFPSYAHALPPVYDVYHVIPIPIEILETGYIDLQEYSFPLSHIFWADNIEILNIDGLSYARLFPTIFASAIALSIYTAASNISKKFASIAPLTFLSMYWYMEAHMARQSFTLVIWALFLLTLLLFLDKKNIQLGSLTILAALSVIISHPGQTIFLFFNLVSLSAISILFIKNKEVWDHLKPVHVITAAAGVFFLYIYHNIEDVQDFFQGLYENIGERGFEGMDLGYRGESSESYDFANNIRALKMVSQSLIAFGATLTAFVKRDRKSITAGVIFLSCYLWLIYPLTHHGRYLERTFMAALIPASILFTYLLTQLDQIDNVNLRTISRYSIIIFILALLVTVPVTKNSIDSFETPSEEGLHSGRFLQQNYNETVYVTDTHEGLFRYLEATTEEEHPIRFRSISGGAVEPVNGVKTGYNTPRTTRMRSNQLFLDYYKNYFSVRFGNETIVEEINEYEERYSTQQAAIYDSGGARFYRET